MKNNRKNARLELRISQAEKESIMRKAKRCGLSTTAYVLQCCSKNAPREKAPAELWQFLNRLYAICDSLPPIKQAELEQLILNVQWGA